MRRRRLPNMGALIAFDAAARYEHFTAAARALSLTESAVSRQVSALESQLGVRLFVRAKQRVILTRAGALYSAQVRRTLDALERDTLAIIAHGSGAGALELAVLPTFASQWLLPRMHDLSARHPSLQVNLGVQTEMFAFGETHFEAAIHYGPPNWPGTMADRLFGEEVVPVCAPALLATLGDLPTHPAALLDLPLLHSTTRPDAWQNWLLQCGVDDPRAMRGARYELFTMLISGARAGLGVALVPRFFLDGLWGDPGLAMPFADWPSRQAAQRRGARKKSGDKGDGAALDGDNGTRHRDADAAYYLVYPTEARHNPPLQMFREWLLGQARAYVGDGAGDPRNPTPDDQSAAMTPSTSIGLTNN
ncbi:LysR substrate-binding domain-containing protein [Robbsia sp. KACC 23696]|uniref:LysR substrate-binding domain-containing protein n=1 Tax=Robbsia sp. KACC 23696 TaxID=3149231 RepID=UPI00325A5EC9